MNLEKMDKSTLALLCLHSGAYQRADGLTELSNEELAGRLRSHVGEEGLVDAARELLLNSAVQLDPEHHTHHNGFWAGNFMLVTQVSRWGVQGFCKTAGGEAHYRATWGTFSYVGQATWVPHREKEEM